MIRRIVAAFVLLGAALSAQSVAPTHTSAQQAPARRAYPERAIRHEIPMTNTIVRAHAAGTRDSTGRPGRNYWQLRTDYTINASLDPATSRIVGREKIVIHNNSPSPLTQIGLRLDQNIFRPHSYLASSWMPSGSAK